MSPIQVWLWQALARTSQPRRYPIFLKRRYAQKTTSEGDAGMGITGVVLHSSTVSGRPRRDGVLGLMRWRCLDPPEGRPSGCDGGCEVVIVARNRTRLISPPPSDFVGGPGLDLVDDLLVEISLDGLLKVLEGIGVVIQFRAGLLNLLVRRNFRDSK